MDRASAPALASDETAFDSSMPLDAAAELPLATSPPAEALASASPEDEVLTTILTAFETRAADVGIRAVVMSELAHDLGMSTKTLYRHFRSKDQLVDAMLDRWQTQVVTNQMARWASFDSFEDRLVGGLTAYVMARDRFCPRFWSDLFGSYPRAGARLTNAIAAARTREAEMMAPAVRPEIDRELIPAMVNAVVRAASEVANFAGPDRDRENVVAQVIRIWVRGALITEVMP